MTSNMVLVTGNAIMYEVCEIVFVVLLWLPRSILAPLNTGMFVSDCFMFRYLIAVNVCLDFDVTFSIAWKIMKGLGFRAHHGRKLAGPA